MTSSTEARSGPGRRTLSLAALVAVVSIAAAPGAKADGDPAAGSVSAARPASTGGGSAVPENPEIANVICRRGCVGLRSPAHGGLVEVSGTGLGSAVSLSFPSARGRVQAPVRPKNDSRLVAAVPEEAIDGRVRVRSAYGGSSAFSRARLDIRSRRELGSAGALTLLEAKVAPRDTYYFGLRMPVLRFVVGSDQPLNDLRVDVVGPDGQAVKSWFMDDVPANTTRTLRWNGHGSNGRPARDGRYAFRVSSQSGALAGRRRVPPGSLAVYLHGHIFPVRGAHDYGSSGSRFGAPRSGHTHQGQDVAAACGTPLVAARGGRVRYAGYEASGAGYYVVINGRGTGRDTVYMHLSGPARVRTGAVVRTGQRLGAVGTTGASTGCHLHFEVWSAPGWYVGGSPLDPYRILRRWDSYS